MFEDTRGTSPIVAVLMTLTLIGIFTHYASTCNSIKRKSRTVAEDRSDEGPRLQRYRGEVPEKVVLAPPGDSLLENKPS